MIKTSEILKKNLLTENEIRLICKRANNEKTRKDTLESLNQEEGKWRITLKQEQKGLNWLINEWRTPKGKERRSNPFGYREQKIINGFCYFTFDGLYNAGEYGFSWYVPIYSPHCEDSSFQYIVKGGKIDIIS